MHAPASSASAVKGRPARVAPIPLTDEAKFDFFKRFFLTQDGW